MWAHFRNIGHEINKKAATDEKNVAMNETFVYVEQVIHFFFANLIHSCLFIMLGSFRGHWDLSREVTCWVVSSKYLTKTVMEKLILLNF